VCENAPIGERLDRADAAFVGRVVAEVAGEVKGQPQRLLTVEVDQRVKGEVEDTVVVRTFSQTDCALDVPRNEPVGLLLTRDTNGNLVGSACSVVDPGVLVAAGGEPRGGVIKVVIGLGFLAIVLSWALRRRQRGARPNLPGAPEP
jgi:MYXO-CTERM domain-containing protein